MNGFDNARHAEIRAAQNARLRPGPGLWDHTIVGNLPRDLPVFLVFSRKSGRDLLLGMFTKFAKQMTAEFAAMEDEMNLEADLLEGDGDTLEEGGVLNTLGLTSAPDNHLSPALQEEQGWYYVSVLSH